MGILDEAPRGQGPGRFKNDFTEGIDAFLLGQADQETGRNYHPSSSGKYADDYIRGWKSSAVQSSWWRVRAYSILWRLEHKVAKIPSQESRRTYWIAFIKTLWKGNA